MDTYFIVRLSDGSYSIVTRESMLCMLPIEVIGELSVSSSHLAINSNILSRLSMVLNISK